MKEGHEIELREFEDWQRGTSRESQFGTKRGTLDWTKTPGRIQVPDEPPKMRWRAVVVLVLVAVLDLGVWRFAVAYVVSWFCRR